MIAELFSSPMGVPVAACALALVLLLGGIAGHVVGLWDLNGPRYARAPRRPARSAVRPAVTRAQRRREIEEDAVEALRVRAQRLDRGDPDLEPTPVDLDALDRKDAA